VSKYQVVLSIGSILIMSCGAAHASTLDITTGSGEEYKVHKGLFGRKDVEVKDRLGDHIEKKKGWFGTQETDVNFLGNHLQKKKGLFGRTSYEGSTILGDKIESKRGLLLPRSTTVNLSGMSALVNAFVSGKKPPMPLMPGQDHSPVTPSVPNVQASPDSQAGSLTDQSGFNSPSQTQP